MEPFIAGVDIANIEQLYGRKREVELLISCAKRKANAGIIGARRFGKTCLLKSMEVYLRLHSDLNAYPLYYNPKEAGIKGNTSETYRTMAAKLAAQMCTDKIIPEGQFAINRRCSLDISRDMIDMAIQMEDWNSQIQIKTIFVLSERIAAEGKYLLLLLDEVDYLLQVAFESPADFSSIRAASSERDCTLKFWAACVSSWSSICTNIGSPELNCGLENITLSLLSEDDFNDMWSYECSLIDDENKKNIFLSLGHEMSKKTGGVPFYAKVVGAHMLIHDIYLIPSYEIIRDYLTEIVNSRFMTDTERDFLYQLSKGEIQLNEITSDGVNGLVSKGLVSVKDGTCSIEIGYLKDYLNALKQDLTLLDSENIDSQELCSLVDQIARLRVSVNRAYVEDEPFDPSIEDYQEFSIIKLRCNNEAGMAAFSGSIYKLYYEGSGKGKYLPSGFERRDFCNMVRTLRHIYNHRDCDTSISMSDKELYRLINQGRPPVKAEDFFFMQKSMLKAFYNELDEMLNRKNTGNKTTGLRGKINGDRTKVLCNYSNLPKSLIIDKKTGFKTNNSPRDYDYGEGEEVIFDLLKGIDYNTGGDFYYAITVRPAGEE